MKQLLAPLCVVFTCLVGLPAAQAKVLVYKMKRTSSKYTEPTGMTGTQSWNNSWSLLVIVDLSTDFFSETAADESLTETISVNDTAKSFSHSYSTEVGGTLQKNFTKFEFFNNSKGFYVFHQDSENFGSGGTDHGAFFATGSCTLNVDIGWVDSATKLNVKSAVPKNFTATQYRGDGGRFTTNVLSFTYDTTITKAVNAYLSASNIKSVKGDEVSLAIPAAKEWLINTYLPVKYPN